MDGLWGGGGKGYVGPPLKLLGGGGWPPPPPPPPAPPPLPTPMFREDPAEARNKSEKNTSNDNVETVYAPLATTAAELYFQID